MLKLLFITLVFVGSLFANKVIYLSYDDVPQRVIKGEVFSVTLKALSIVPHLQNIYYTFENAKGLEILDASPTREKNGKYYYDTFHMLVTSSNARLPDVTASLGDDEPYDTTTIKGKKLNVITLNPKHSFCGVLANSFELLEYKTTSFDDKHNIVIFVAKATNSNLKALHINNAYKQGIESFSGDYKDAKVTYFVVIDKKIENFTFSYFNLEQNKYKLLSIPIVVDDDSVSTQSDLKPTDQSHEMIKVYIAAALAVVLLLFIIWRRKYFYVVLILFPLGYIAYIILPDKDVCIQKGAKIYLLPVSNGTIFEITNTELHLTKEGSVTNFTKVKLQNNKIGWVKNEDTCSY